jgi:rhodanese-related sulfurtransferase
MNISIEKLHQVLDSKPQILDVREKDEFDNGHIPLAQHYPLSNIKEWSKTLDKEKTYYLICASGVRSFNACLYLKMMGIEKVYNIEEGTFGWIEKGFELEK